MTVAPAPASVVSPDAAEAGRRSRLVPTIRRAALALAAGALLYAGHPPIDLAAAGWVALVPLLVLARDLGHGPRRVRRAAGWGLLAGLAFFVPLLEWLSPFGGVVPWLVLALIQAVAVAVFLAGVVVWGPRPGRAAMAVVWWVALEAVRGSVPMGGFPWGLLGYTQHDGGPLLPIARTLGVLGVSAACAAVAACLEELGTRAVRLRRPRPPVPEAARGAVQPLRDAGPGLPGEGQGPREPRTRRLHPLAVPALGLAAVVALGPLVGWRPPAPTGETLDIASVQGTDLRASGAAGINRRDEGRIVRVAEQMLAATRPLAADPPQVTVWPENALDSDITDPRNTAIRAVVAEALTLLDGGPLLGNTFEDGPPGPIPTYYNAVLEITPDGIDERYRKQRPVPVGEFVPLRGLLELYPTAEQLPGYDVLPGAAAPPLSVAGARIGTVICYENVWTDLVRAQVRGGADLLLISTNNTPFGGAMSRQHLTFSQLRAVETGRWVLHAGVSGISGVVDPYGDITQVTAQDEQAIVRADIPLVESQTLATRLGDVIAHTALALSVLGILATITGRPRQVP